MRSAPLNYVPGRPGGQLTSYGGQLYEQSGHTTALQFLNAGAAGSYGTVIEPCTYLAKFPSPQDYFYQARGFSMAECYYQSVTNPYQGLLLGEPLAAPFALPPAGAWSSLPANALLSGTTNLSLQFTAADADSPGPAGGPVRGRHVRPNTHQHSAATQQHAHRDHPRPSDELHRAGRGHDPVRRLPA